MTSVGCWWLNSRISRISHPAVFKKWVDLKDRLIAIYLDWDIDGYCIFRQSHMFAKSTHLRREVSWQHIATEAVKPPTRLRWAKDGRIPSSKPILFSPPQQILQMDPAWFRDASSHEAGLGAAYCVVETPSTACHEKSLRSAVACHCANNRLGADH